MRKKLYDALIFGGISVLIVLIYAAIKGDLDWGIQLSAYIVFFWSLVVLIRWIVEKNKSDK
ncbi:MAG: hypothetical protein HLX50_16795 [Alteromonadaceae bacterium]|nr:hypothetical protein [Alteromonadaceae bacterium]